MELESESSSRDVVRDEEDSSGEETVPVIVAFQGQDDSFVFSWRRLLLFAGTGSSLAESDSCSKHGGAVNLDVRSHAAHAALSAVEAVGSRSQPSTALLLMSVPALASGWLSNIGCCVAVHGCLCRAHPS